MSDYGFATYNEKTGSRTNGVVNSSWPIFGPNYSDIEKSFRTIHITDTKQYDFRSSSISRPSASRSAINQYHGYVKVLVATIPHGHKKRPMGYATIAGSFVKNTRGKWQYTRTTDYYNFFPPSTTLTNVGIVSGNMIGSDLIRPTSATGDFGVFEANLFSSCNITYPNDTYAYLSQNYYSIPGDNSSNGDAIGDNRPPYAVEIDNTNVYLYRYYYWSDVWKRDYYYDERVVWDVEARMYGIIDYAGSDFDLTIYLCPYSMEDFI